MSLNTTPRTWVTAEVVTAAYMNTEVRDAFIGVQSAWNSYTPVLSASPVNPVIGGTGFAIGRWQQYGKTIVGDATIAFGSGSTFGSGQWSVTLPAAIATVANRNLTCDVSIFDASAGIHLRGLGKLAYGGTQAVPLFAPISSGTSPQLVLVSSTQPMTWAASDQLMISFVAEGA